jgi:MoaA/NifB/PqqE/SkfB family radical SAM enzyme
MNLLTVAVEEEVKTIKRTRRVEIYTGFGCNLKCAFCYYIERLSGEQIPIECLKKELVLARKYGALDVDFTGGEATIRRDLPELISFAKNLGFRDICIITNGLMMANRSYCDELVKCGLNDVLFSIHGLNETHDQLTRVPGSFQRITKAVENIKNLGIKFRTNTTVVKHNFKQLPETGAFFLKLKPESTNFIMFNPWYSSGSQKEEVTCRYSEAVPFLKKAIDGLAPEIKKVTVRYIPYCFMEGYEQHICNFPHRKYDTDEWSHSTRLRLDSKFFWGSILYRMVRYRVPPKRFSDIDDLVDHIVVTQVQRSLHVKAEDCTKCKHYRICDGVKKGYAQLFGLNEINPVKGERIKDPMYFRKPYLNRFDD